MSGRRLSEVYMA